MNKYVVHRIETGAHIPKCSLAEAAAEAAAAWASNVAPIHVSIEGSVDRWSIDGDGPSATGLLHLDPPTWAKHVYTIAKRIDQGLGGPAK